MKKFLFIIIIALIVIASGAWQSHAFDVGKGVSIDGFLTAGKLWDVDFSDTDRQSTINATTNKGEIYFEGEVGVRYKFMRPFAGYQYLGGIMQDEVFSVEKLGVDWFPISMPAGKLASLSVGIRTSYNWFRATEFLKHDFAYTGLIVKW